MHIDIKESLTPVPELENSGSARHIDIKESLTPVPELENSLSQQLPFSKS